MSIFKNGNKKEIIRGNRTTSFEPNGSGYLKKKNSKPKKSVEIALDNKIY